MSFLFRTTTSSLVRAVGPATGVQQQKRLLSTTMHGTTILCVRKEGRVALIGDGMVSMGSQIVKGNAKKVRRIGDDVIVGFAGSTADAFTLLERLERKLEEHPGQLTRACVDLAKAWRTEKYLRRLEALLLVADANITYELTGNGDVIEPQYGVASIGSGGAYALAAARALIDTDLDAPTIARKAMHIAADMCVYTNDSFILEELGGPNTNEPAPQQDTASLLSGEPPRAATAAAPPKIAEKKEPPAPEEPQKKK